MTTTQVRLLIVFFGIFVLSAAVQFFNKTSAKSEYYDALYAALSTMKDTSGNLDELLKVFASVHDTAYENNYTVTTDGVGRKSIGMKSEFREEHYLDSVFSGLENFLTSKNDRNLIEQLLIYEKLIAGAFDTNSWLRKKINRKTVDSVMANPGATLARSGNSNLGVVAQEIKVQQVSQPTYSGPITPEISVLSNFRKSDAESLRAGLSIDFYVYSPQRDGSLPSGCTLVGVNIKPMDINWGLYDSLGEVGLKLPIDPSRSMDKRVKHVVERGEVDKRFCMIASQRYNSPSKYTIHKAPNQSTCDCI